MAKPKGATLTRLFAVSDEERKKFWADLEAQKGKKSPEAGIPLSGVPDKGIPESTLPIADPLIIGTPVTGIPNIGTPDSTNLVAKVETGIPVVGIPVSDTPLPTAPTSPLIHRKIREAIKVQDGHSLGEQAVYAALWGAGQPAGEDCRRVTIGYRTLSDACGLTVNNCKANLQALRRKLAIDEAAAATRMTGTTYLVFSYQAILRRRRQAGMTHVIKTKGVTFVNPQSGIPVSGIPDLPIGEPAPGIPAMKSGTPAPNVPGVPDSGTHIRNRNLLEEKEIQEPSSSFPVVVAAARKQGIVLDDDAARRIVLRSKTFDETATDNEVAYFLEAKILQLRNSRNVENFVGLLIRAVPEFFAPPATELRTLREQIAAKAAESRELAQRILDDPEASENDREWARAALQGE